MCVGSSWTDLSEPSSFSSLIINNIPVYRAIIFQCEALIASKGGKEFQVRL